MDLRPSSSRLRLMPTQAARTKRRQVVTPDLPPGARAACRTPDAALNGLIDAACVSVIHYGCVVRYVDDTDLHRHALPMLPNSTAAKPPRRLSDYRAARPLLVAIVASPPELLISRRVLQGLRHGAPDALSDAYAVAGGIVALAARCATIARLGDSVAHLVCTSTGDGGYRVTQSHQAQPQLVRPRRPSVPRRSQQWQYAVGDMM